MSDASMLEFEDQEKINEEVENLNQAEIERELARELYDREDVRKAGQEALSKVSALLIRYNRLKDAENRRKIDSSSKETEAKKILDMNLEKIREKRTEIAQLTNDEDKTKAITQLDAAETTARREYDEEILKARKNAEKSYVLGLAQSIDDDSSGGILSTLMLGGNATGSLGYTLTSGDAVDLMKGGAYISDMTKEGGTFLSQMALLDNAVNTNGIDLNKKDDEYENFNRINRTLEGNYIGSSLAGAQYSLGDVLRNITDEDISEINRFTGKQLSLDMESLKSEREYAGLDQEIGVQDPKKTLLEAFEERGISKEAKARMQGKIGGVNDWDKKEKKKYLPKYKPVAQVQGFFSSVFGKKPAYMRERRGAARRRALREERLAWEAEMNALAAQRDTSDFTFEKNENDTAEKTFANLEEQQSLNATDAQALLEINKDKDKSARNMIAAYRLLGASPRDLYLFRLALIAYMVPTGKKTIAQILRESEEAGYKGNEDLSSPQTMLKTFQDEPIVEGKFVNNAKAREQKRDAVRNMNTANREKMLQAVANSEDKDKSEQIKNLAASRWMNQQNQIEEVNEEEEEKEEDNELESQQEENQQEENTSENQQEDLILEKALKHHFEIIGKNQMEQECLQTFLEIFEREQENEYFDTTLLPNELVELKSKINSNEEYKKEILSAIQKML